MENGKRYIGTKILDAVPMTLGEYNIYRGWDLPKDEVNRVNGEGYLVEYLGGGTPNHPKHKGYISWSPKDVFEKAYMIADTFLDRMRIELLELSEKITKINDALIDGLVPMPSISMLNTQLYKMLEYEKVLKQRIEIAENGVAVEEQPTTEHPHFNE